MPRKAKKKGKQLVTKQYLNSKLSRSLETKYKFVAASTNDPDYSGEFMAITNGISQGTAQGSRTGDRFTPVYVHLKGHVELADTTNFIRLIVYRWHEDYADMTSPSAILENIGSVNSPLSMYVTDPEKRKRFTVLADRLFNLHAYAPVKPFDIRIPARKLRNKPVQCTPGAAGGTNQIVALLISDSSAVTHPGITTEVLVKYKDG